MNQKGFTLIELLVVISVIGMLASIILVSLSGGRAKARDARRKVDVNQIQKAFELMISDNGWPPNDAGTWIHLNNPCSSGLTSTLVPKYFASMPDDPLSPGLPPFCVAADGYWYYFGIGYKYDGINGVTAASVDNYIICSKLENTADQDYHIIGNLWGRGWTLNYCVGN
ncbi:MAG: type II secretion system protein [Candidatus Doudnabacteria bacterium]